MRISLNKAQMGRLSAFALLLLSSGLLASCGNRSEQEIGVYSGRHYNTDQALYDRFTTETGIKVKLLEAKDDALIQRLRSEGSESPADVLILADAARLDRAADLDLFQAVDSDKLKAAIPADLRDPANRWFGLTMRARVVYASKERSPQQSITYEELAEPKWKGRICVRSGQHVYNLGLISAMIANRGETATKQWLQGLKANLALKPSGNDRSQAKSVFAGECDIAIGNTYYMGKMMTNEECEHFWHDAFCQCP